MTQGTRGAHPPPDPSPQILDLLGMPYRVLSAKARSAGADLRRVASPRGTRMSRWPSSSPLEWCNGLCSSRPRSFGQRSAGTRRRVGGRRPAMRPEERAPRPAICGLAATTPPAAYLQTEPIVHPTHKSSPSRSPSAKPSAEPHMICSMGLALARSASCLTSAPAEALPPSYSLLRPPPSLLVSCLLAMVGG